MSVLDRLERKFGRFGIPHLTILMVASQGSTFILQLANPELVASMTLIPAKVLEGEVWRLFTFMLTPPGTHWLWGIFALYLLYLFGTALEAKWGSFRYTLYVAIAFFLTLAVSWLKPGAEYGVGFIDLSVMLAFAYLFPDFELAIFLILPVKIKYIAMLAWGFVGIQVFFGAPHAKLTALASVANFMLFFGPDIARGMKGRQRQMSREVKETRSERKAMHTCAVCGATEGSHPDEHWRVCSTCSDGREYCSQHIRDHEHQ